MYKCIWIHFELYHWWVIVNKINSTQDNLYIDEIMHLADINDDGS